MGLFGNILSTGVNIINIPAEIIDKVILEDDSKEGTFSSAGREVSKIVKKIDE
jgi:hypothetical protein